MAFLSYRAYMLIPSSAPLMMICEEPTQCIASAQGVNFISSAQAGSCAKPSFSVRLNALFFHILLRMIYLEIVLDCGNSLRPIFISTSPTLDQGTRNSDCVLNFISPWLSYFRVFYPKNVFLSGTVILCILCWTGIEHFCTLQNKQWLFPPC